MASQGLRTVAHGDIRLADNVVTLSELSATSFRRDRSNSFIAVKMVELGSLTPQEVVRSAVGSLESKTTIDVVLGEDLSTIESSAKSFGSGWRISSEGTVLEVFVNDLFAKNAIALRIDQHVFLEACQLVADCDADFGRLFFTRPNREFRYSVFCPVSGISSLDDVLNSTEVCFSVSIPSFLQPDRIEFRHYNGVASFAHYATEPDPDRENAGTAASPASARPETLAVLPNGWAVSPERGFVGARTVPCDTPVSESRAAGLSDSVEREGDGPDDAATRSGIGSEAYIAGSLPDNDGLSVPEHESTVIFKHYEGWPSVYSSEAAAEENSSGAAVDIPVRNSATLCVLLDESLDSAIAAAAYLLSQDRKPQAISEIGLWRRRFESSFSKFFTIDEVVEFTSLPLSEHDLAGFDDFCARVAALDEATHQVFVVGPELFGESSFGEVSVRLLSRFEALEALVVGRNESSFSSALPSISDAISKARNCVVLLGVESGADDPLAASNPDERERFSIPSFLKQSLLLAARSGNGRERLREIADQILR